RCLCHTKQSRIFIRHISAVGIYRGTAMKLQRKYNSVAIAQNGRKLFHSEDIAYKI
ncbi:hypothetical protein HGM15179_016733, partial [Zosterops borbonicus]